MEDWSSKDTAGPGGQRDSILVFKDETKKVLESFLRRSLSVPETTAVGRVGGCYHSDYDHRRKCQKYQSNGSVAKSGNGTSSATNAVLHDGVEVDPDWTEVHDQINDAEEKKHGFKTRIKKLFSFGRNKKKKEFYGEICTAAAIGEGGQRSPSPPAPQKIPECQGRSSSKTKRRGIGFFSLRRKVKEDIDSCTSGQTSPRPSTLPLKNISRPTSKNGPRAVVKDEAGYGEKDEFYEKVARRLERLANQHQQRAAQSQDFPSLSPEGACGAQTSSETLIDESPSKPLPIPPRSSPEAARKLTEQDSPVTQWHCLDGTTELEYPLDVCGTRSLEISCPSPDRTRPAGLRNALLEVVTLPRKDEKPRAAADAPVNKDALMEELKNLIMDMGDNINCKKLLSRVEGQIDILHRMADSKPAQYGVPIKENPLLGEVLDRMSYPSFCNVTNAFITAGMADTPSPKAVQLACAASPDEIAAADVVDASGAAVTRQPTPGGDASPQQPEVLQIALAMELTKRMAVINRRAVTRIMGFGAQYLEERFSPWILKQGGWQNIIDIDNSSEIDVD